MEFSMTRNVHVVPHADGWAVRIEGNERVSSIHDTQGDAIGQDEVDGYLIQRTVEETDGTSIEG